MADDIIEPKKKYYRFYQKVMCVHCREIFNYYYIQRHLKNCKKNPENNK